MDLDAREIRTWNHWQTRWNARGVTKPEKLGLLHVLPDVIDHSLEASQASFICDLLAAAYVRYGQREYWHKGVWVLEWLVKDRLSRMIHKQDTEGLTEFVEQFALLPIWLRYNRLGPYLGAVLRAQLAQLVEEFGRAEHWFTLPWIIRNEYSHQLCEKISRAFIGLEAFDCLVKWELFEALPALKSRTSHGEDSTERAAWSVGNIAKTTHSVMEAAFYHIRDTATPADEG